MRKLIFASLATFLFSGALWALSPASPEPAAAQNYKGYTYYVLSDFKTLLIENPMRVSVTVVKLSSGYYLGIFGRPEDRIRPEAEEIKKLFPGFASSLVGVSAIKKVTIDMGIGRSIDAQLSSTSSFFQASENLSKAEGETIISNVKAGITPKVDLVVDTKIPAYNVVEQYNLDYSGICQKLKQNATKATVSGAANSLVGLFVNNQIQVRNSSLRYKVVDAILKNCTEVQISDEESSNFESWPGLRVNFLGSSKIETIVQRSLAYIPSSQGWTTTIEVTTP